MEIKSKLKTDIPQFVYYIKQIKDIIDAIQPDIDKLNETLRQMKYDLHITTTNIIERFEIDYGITPDDSIPMEQRVLNLLNKRNLVVALNEERLIELIKNNYGTDFEIIENWSNYLLEIICKDNTISIATLQLALEKAKPAHLSVLFAILAAENTILINDSSTLISTLVRRCGTFTGGTEPL